MWKLDSHGLNPIAIFGIQYSVCGVRSVVFPKLAESLSRDLLFFSFHLGPSVNLHSSILDLNVNVKLLA